MRKKAMSNKSLKPCPHCGREDCCATAEAWNALPRRLQWTKETPTEAGWYFIRYKGKITICRADYPKGAPYMTYRVIGSPDAWNTKHADEWAGPIPEPMEPK